MEALLVLDDCFNCYDKLVSHHGFYGNLETEQPTIAETDCDQEAYSKKCENKILGENPTCHVTGYDSDNNRGPSNQVTENSIHLSEYQDVILETFINLLPRFFSHEKQKTVPCPYSILDRPTSDKKYHFDTILIKKGNISGGQHLSNILVLSIDSYLASAVTYSLTKTDKFWIGFSNFVTELFKRSGISLKQSKKKTNGRLDRIVSFVLHQPRKHVINYPW
jgi:hypothetical protein